MEFTHYISILIVPTSGSSQYRSPVNLYSYYTYFFYYSLATFWGIVTSAIVLEDLKELAFESKQAYRISKVSTELLKTRGQQIF